MAAKKKAQKKPKPVAVITRVRKIDCEWCGDQSVMGVSTEHIGNAELYDLCFDCLREWLEELAEKPDEEK